MSKKESKKNQLDTQQVSDFLQQNPQYLIENPALMRAIELKAELPEGVASLIEYQVRILREQNNSLARSLVNIRDVAKANEKVWQGLYDFLLALMKVEKKPGSKPYWTEVCKLFESQFALDRVSYLSLASRNRKAVREFITNNISLESSSNGAIIVRRELVEELSQLVFGESSGSMVLFNIDIDAKHMLLLASDDAERYTEELGTIQLGRLVAALRSHVGVCISDTDDSNK